MSWWRRPSTSGRCAKSPPFIRTCRCCGSEISHPAHAPRLSSAHALARAPQLDYRRAAARTVARHEHEGPLRILQTLYPEGDAIAHNVLVHPPSGLVAGDTLDIAL